jgi:putative endonuclease
MPDFPEQVRRNRCWFPGGNSMGAHNAIVGRTGEDRAVGWLTEHGMRVIERNWRCADGEIDIVAAEGATAVFVEVKTRTSTRTGHPFEAITASKIARLRRLAARWCADHPAARPAALRIDAVSVLLASDGVASVEHVRGVA